MPLNSSSSAPSPPASDKKILPLAGSLATVSVTMSPSASNTLSGTKTGVSGCVVLLVGETSDGCVSLGGSSIGVTMMVIVTFADVAPLESRTLKLRLVSGSPKTCWSGMNTTAELPSNTSSPSWMTSPQELVMVTSQHGESWRSVPFVGTRSTMAVVRSVPCGERPMRKTATGVSSFVVTVSWGAAHCTTPSGQVHGERSSTTVGGASGSKCTVPLTVAPAPVAS
mmetsp:Transcript_41864/g.122452  ORF Transcript_41864/g.122452 Transcript_41864/m.122452 type:complete len:225 (-) Transcript_41864:144-818(-)